MLIYYGVFKKKKLSRRSYCLVKIYAKMIYYKHLISATNWLNRISGVMISHMSICRKGCHGRDRRVVKFTTTYAISAYHH
jgi:hypothetical protein